MNGMPIEFAFVVLGIIIFMFMLLIFIFIRIRGEVYRLWVNSVPYFHKIKPNRPLRIKVTRGLALTLTKNLVEIVDKTIYKPVKETNPKKKIKLEKLPGVPDSLVEMWEKIRENPEKYSIWSFYFTKRWRTPDGNRGRWVFAYCLFSLEEMTKQLGRHKMVQGVFLEKPLSVHVPSTKDEWVQSKLKEDREKGLKPTAEQVKKYEKEYRRILKEKWLNIIFHPTVTVIKESEVMDRVTGFENVMAVTTHVMSELGTKLAKFEVYKYYFLSSQELIRNLQQVAHKVADRLGRESQLSQQLNRTIKELRTPVHISTEGAPWPSVSAPPPPEKPRGARAFFTGINELDLINWLIIGIGLFSTISGIAIYVANPKMIGTLVVGALLLLVGFIMFAWRKRKTVKFPESVSESAEAIKETVEGG